MPWPETKANDIQEFERRNTQRVAKLEVQVARLETEFKIHKYNTELFTFISGVALTGLFACAIFRP